MGSESYLALTREEADVAATALRGVLDGLQTLLQEQASTLPPGDPAWQEVAERLAVGQRAWLKLSSAVSGMDSTWLKRPDVAAEHGVNRSKRTGGWA